MNTNETYTHMMGEETRWIDRHNKQVWESREREAKEREEEIARRRSEWNAMPDEKKICAVCTLPLDEVTKAKISENPFHPQHHEFCSKLQYEPHVARGLVGLLREAYGNDTIPLATLKQIIETWDSQKGRCYISQIQMSFTLDDKPPMPLKRPALVDPLQHGMMENQRQKEWAQSQRHAVLHRPTIFFDVDGTLRLVSASIQKFREGLSDFEFFDLIQTLHDRLPALQKNQIMNFSTPTHTSAVHRRDRGRY